MPILLIVPFNSIPKEKTSTWTIFLSFLPICTPTPTWKRKNWIGQASLFPLARATTSTSTLVIKVSDTIYIQLYPNQNLIPIGFCRDSVFSITAAHNGGALPCRCDSQGSSSFECQQFGGQCKCKENVIGRQCNACKTRYYGFPDCRPCNCPSTANCEATTGTYTRFSYIL